MRSILVLVVLGSLGGCRLVDRDRDAGARADAGVDAPPTDIGDAAARDVATLDVGRDSPDAAGPPRDRVTDDCRFYSARRGAFIELHGDVQFVDAFADFEIEEVTSFPDLNVELVGAFPDDCGEWREVTSFPDFTVEVVDSFGDFDVRYVTSFPGLP